jgi:hypothetical protein
MIIKLVQLVLTIVSRWYEFTCRYTYQKQQSIMSDIYIYYILSSNKGIFV